MRTSFAQRRRALQQDIAEAGLGALLITKPASWYYLTGFTGEAGVLVVRRRGAAIVTDGRFTAQARLEAAEVQVVQQEGALASAVGQLLRRSGGGKVGFDAA